MITMDAARVLVVADTPEVSKHLAVKLLPEAGYISTQADSSTVPAPCDVVLVDVTRLLSAPFAGLKAQRRMGCDAPAILFAPRLTGQMAAEVFQLGVREFVTMPVDDKMRLGRLAQFVADVQQEQERLEAQKKLEQTRIALERRLNEMNTLSHIGRAIASLSDIDQVLSHIVEAGVYLTRADEGAIFLLDEQSGRLFLRAEQGLGDKRAEAIRQPSDDSEAATVLKTGQPIMRGSESEHKVKTGYLVRALINVPIILGRHVIGVLAVYNHGQRSFESFDQVILSHLADYAAIVLDRVRAQGHIEDRIKAALQPTRKILLHAETLYDPVDGIGAQADTLLGGGFAPLNERQYAAVTGIKNATLRLKEIIGFIRQEAAVMEETHTEG